jgi:hypothetical protein
MTLLSRGNSDLRRDGIWTWTLPAWVTHLPDGRTINTCPSAGECAPRCYARKGTYQFSNVKAKHLDNLRRVLDDLPQWADDMSAELARIKKPDAHIRIHDSGDFFTPTYLDAWLMLIARHQTLTFYAYTKEIALFRQAVEPLNLPNFHYVYSYGGRQDKAITDQDRRCDVFPTDESLQAAGYHDQADSDLLAIYGPPAVGIVINNHRGAANAMKGKSMRQLQAERHTP